MVAEFISGCFTGVLGDGNTADIKPKTAKDIHQTKYILVVGDAQIAPDLIGGDGSGGDSDHDLCLIL